MTIQMLVEILLASMVASAIFGGPVAAVIGWWLLRDVRPWRVLPVAKPVQGG